MVPPRDLDASGQALATLPALRHDVQTFKRLRCPGLTSARTVWMFGFHRR